MSVVVAYGDSNTWGSDPATGARFAPNQRWTGVMSEALGGRFRVIEEGLRGRTTVPFCGSKSPVRIFMSVDLPAPLGPVMA